MKNTRKRVFMTRALKTVGALMLGTLLGRRSQAVRMRSRQTPASTSLI